MKYTLLLFTLILSSFCQAQSNDSRVVRTNIIDNLEDWDGEVILKMRNGQLWQLYDSQHRSRVFSLQKVVIYKEDCSWFMNIESNQTFKVIQVDGSYINTQKNLHEQMNGGYIYSVVRASWAQRLIVKKGDSFYLMNVLNGECCTMGTMKFDETNFNYQNVLVKEWPNSLGVGFRMKIIEESRNYSQLEEKITN